MFKKNTNRPPITINLRKVNSGYKVILNDSFNPFSFKKITRAIFKISVDELQNNKGPDNMQGMAQSEAVMQQPMHTTIPLSAKWFDFDEIHEIEREAFHQFFIQEDQEGRLFKKSPRLYKFYRNCIILLWRQNPKKYLSPSICRKTLPGDVSAIIRVHAFLEHWGLINFPSKEHAKGYVFEKAQEYTCHVCQQRNSSEYYLWRVSEGNVFQVCHCCYQGQVYPEFLNGYGFKKVTVTDKNALSRRKMAPEEVQKMLEMISSQSHREKDLWNSLSQTFPAYTKQQIIYNFLLVPNSHKMNSNIFFNNEDLIQESCPPENEVPTIFEDYQNQQQICIAYSYYLWKNSKQKQKTKDLSQIFERVPEFCANLAEIQNEKCSEMIRMLIDVQQSKLELKSIFIQELGKIVEAEVNSFGAITANYMAEEIKNREIGME